MLIHINTGAQDDTDRRHCFECFIIAQIVISPKKIKFKSHR